MKRWIRATDTRSRINLLENAAEDLEIRIAEAKNDGADEDYISDLYNQLAEVEDELRFAWADDEAEWDYARNAQEFNPDGSLKLYGSTQIAEPEEVPELLADKHTIFMLNSVNSTYNDDILEIAENLGAVKLRYGYFSSTGKYFPWLNVPWRFAVKNEKVAKDIYDEVKNQKIPIHQDRLVTSKVDWEDCYQIRVDDYDKGSYSLDYHNYAPKRA